MTRKHLSLICLSLTFVVWSSCKKKTKETPETLTWEYAGAWGAGGTGDGQFDLITGMAIDKNGNQYISDHNLNRVQQLGPTGEFVTKWGTLGTGDGQFTVPREIEVLSNGNIEVADQENGRFQTFTPSGNFVSKFGTVGTGDGQFTITNSFDIAPNGNLFALDPENNRVQQFSPSRAFVNNWAVAPFIGYPYEIRCAADGGIYVAFVDIQTSAVSTVIQYNTSGTIQNSWVAKFADSMTYIRSMDFDSEDRLFIGGSDGIVRIYDKAGNFIKQWGTPGAGQGQILSLTELCIGPNDDVYIAGCQGNKNCRISKFTRKN